jgi:hypothetical protein
MLPMHPVKWLGFSDQTLDHTLLPIRRMDTEFWRSLPLAPALLIRANGRMQYA